MSQHSRRRRALATGTAVGIGWLGSLSVAACSGDPDQPAASVTPAASTPSVPGDGTEPVQGPSAGTSEPREPVLPAAAWGDSVRSAKAFVEYYIDLLNYAMVSGDTEAFRAASSNCEGCDRYAELFEQTHEGGGEAQTKGWAITYTSAHSVRKSVVALVEIDAARLVLKPSNNSAIETSPSESYSLKIDLKRTSGTWSVTNLGSTS